MPMKFALSLLFTLAITFTVVLADTKTDTSAAAAQKPTTGPATTQAASTQAVNKSCAVMSPDDLVDPKYNVIYQDRVIGFCCEECADTFKKKPERHLKTMK